MPKAKALPSREDLVALLTYDPESGGLTWRHRPTARPQWNSRYAGKPAFTAQTAKGYYLGAVQERLLFAHRVIWMMVTGEEPDEIDHEDGNPANNRFSNLKPAGAVSNHRNMARFRNNKSGATGVHYDKRAKKWLASIGKSRRTEYLGHFRTFEEALERRKRAETAMGFHRNHGRSPIGEVK